MRKNSKKVALSAIREVLAWGIEREEMGNNRLFGWLYRGYRLLSDPKIF